MRIKQALVSRGLGGFYFDDYTAVKAGAVQDGFMYPGQPMTAGHRRIRQAGETMSIILVLDDDTMAFGDAVAIQYMGVVGRDPVLLADRYIPVVEQHVLPWLKGRQLTSFRQLSEEFDALEADGAPLHTGIRYGVSQAFLDALAKAQRRTMAEVVASEYGTEISRTPIPVLAQSGDDRFTGADKMILKKVDAIPQGLFNHVSKVGEQGEVLLDYVRWLRKRVEEYGEPGYVPTFHLDVYGIVGDIFANKADQIATYLIELEQVAKPFPIRFEDPVVMDNRQSQFELMRALKDVLAERGSSVEISLDEWCNTVEDTVAAVDMGVAHMIQIKTPSLGCFHNAVEAALYCKQNGVAAFVGGTCNGTDQSTRVTVHVALATKSDLIYNKPGMGVDEGYMIVYNEMQRTLALLDRQAEREQ
jgi:methylaspartate ammonia-lyase